MKHLTLKLTATVLALILTAAALTSCSTTEKTESIDYVVAHGYFLRNDAPTTPPLRYDSQSAFDSTFGCAAVMGKDGAPTAIDFDRQCVIAVIGEETNRPTDFSPVALTAHADTLRLTYRARSAAPTTYTMTPLLLLLVDKAKVTPTTCIAIERE